MPGILLRSRFLRHRTLGALLGNFFSANFLAIEQSFPHDERGIHKVIVATLS